MKESFIIKGHLVIIEHMIRCGKLLQSRKIFDRDNLIVTEGKNAVLALLGKYGLTLNYNADSFNGIVLTKNQSAENLTDTFASSVKGATDYISAEGVLRIPTYTTCSNSPNPGTLTVVGTLGNGYGNDPANNIINSATVCMGLSAGTSGGPGGGPYILSGNEKLFSRVNIGSIVKTSANEYTFQWVFSIV